jgi:hypothetical protein
VDEEAVLVNLKTNRIYSLNPTGARLWELISVGNDREAAEAALLADWHPSVERYEDRRSSVLRERSASPRVIEGVRECPEGERQPDHAVGEQDKRVLSPARPRE